MLVGPPVWPTATGYRPNEGDGLMKRTTPIVAVLTLLLGSVGQATADSISWNTWTSDSAGSMTVGSTSVTVTFSTDNFHTNIANYPSWTPASTWADGVVVNNAP